MSSQLRTNYNRLNKVYHVSLLPILGLLFFIFYESLVLGDTTYQYIALCIAICFFGSSELYYINISREDLERRYGFAYYVMKGKASLEYLYQLLINDGRAMFCTFGGIYFLHVYLTSNLVPYIPYIMEEPTFDLRNVINIVYYIPAFLLSSTLPMQARLKKETDDSSEIINESTSYILLNFERSVHVIDENRFLYNQLLKRVQDEVKVMQNEAQFQSIIKGMNWKVEVFKIIISIGMSFI